MTLKHPQCLPIVEKNDLSPHSATKTRAKTEAMVVANVEDPTEAMAISAWMIERIDYRIAEEYIRIGGGPLVFPHQPLNPPWKMHRKEWRFQNTAELQHLNTG